ncbi:MAG: antitoxin Xre-like helix-turn-helix domain-containing protein, partial [Pseudomonadota bacterium]
MLTKAVGRAAEVMGLRQAEVTEILGLSAATVSRLMRGDYTLRPAAKEFELAALLVRVFRSLDAIAGGDQTVMRAWLRAPNSALRAV